jgi:hypothetical protein
VGGPEPKTATVAKDAGSTTPPAGTPAPVSSAPLATVQMMVSEGRGPAEIAAVIVANPGARDEILFYLHTTRGNWFVQQVLAAATRTCRPGGDVMLADAPVTKIDDDPIEGSPDMVPMVVIIDGQYVQVYVAPGGINRHPDVFMFFHGQNANLMIQPKLEGPADNVSGNDTAATAMKQAKAKNTLAILPQGVDGVAGGGGMKGLEKGGDLPTFLDKILAAVGAGLGKTGTMEPKHIALAGHSAGGYMGVHEALSTAGRYEDTISDITLMDSSYSEVHFSDASKWMFKGPPNKTLRIVQSSDQINNRCPHHDVTTEPPRDPRQRDGRCDRLDRPGREWLRSIRHQSDPRVRTRSRQAPSRQRRRSVQRPGAQGAGGGEEARGGQEEGGEVKSSLRQPPRAQ